MSSMQGNFKALKLIMFSAPLLWSRTCISKWSTWLGSISLSQRSNLTS